MNETKTFDRALARAYSMEYGTAVGLLCSASFLCAMYGLTFVLLGQLSNLLGLVAVYVAGRLIRKFRQRVVPITFGQACYMAVLTYAFAILLTAIVQYLYFAYLDQGRLLARLDYLLTLPEYRQLLTQLAPEGNVEGLLQAMASVMRNPAVMTFQLMWFNLLLSLFVLLPTAWIAMSGNRRERETES